MLTDTVVLNLLLAFAQFSLLTLLMLQGVSVSRNQSAASLHWLLLCTFLLAFVLPLAHIHLPKFNIVLLAGPIEGFAQLIEFSDSAKAWLFYSVQSGLLFGFVYATISACISLFYLPKLQMLSSSSARELVVLERLVNVLGIRKPVSIGYSTDVVSACTWGLFKPHIALPMEARQWSDHTLQRVLHHECCHIRRKDWAITLVVNFARRLLWFVPFSSVLAKKIHWFAELACDDSVLKFWSREEYAGDLLMLAKSQARAKHFPNYEVVNSIDYGEAYARIDAVLDPTRIRTGIPRPVFVLGMVILLGSLMVSSLRINVDKYPVETQWVEIRVPTEGDEQQKTSASGAIAKTSEGKETLILKPTDDKAILISEAGIPVLPLALSTNVSSGIMEAMPEEDFVNIDSPVLNMGESLVFQVLPEYPRSALNRGREGVAELEFDINSKGEPYNIRVISSEPYASFGRSATEAVRRYRYLPKIEAGRVTNVKNKMEVFYFRIEP